MLLKINPSCQSDRNAFALRSVLVVYQRVRAIVIRLVFAAIVGLLAGCVGVAKTSVGIASNAGKGAVSAAGNVAEAGVNAARAGGHASDRDGAYAFKVSDNAMGDVNAALARAKRARHNTIIVLGADWCHDSDALLSALGEDPALSSLVERKYEIVLVDVGEKDRNLDVAHRFGIAGLYGTPTVLVVSADERLLNRGTAHQWRNSSTFSVDYIRDYFAQYAQVR